MSGVEAPAGPAQRKDVVADHSFVGVLGEPAAGEADDLRLLRFGDGVEALSGGERCARLHLDEGDRASAAHDEVELSVARAHIAGDDAIPAQAIEPCGIPFTETTELLG